MRISRLYVEARLQPGASLTLPPDASHYLATVLRLGAESSLIVFNGSDGEFTASIKTASKKQVVVSIAEQLRPPIKERLQIHLGIGLSRGERMDFVMQKATELGVSRITPLYCQFGEVRFKEPKRLDNKLRHWQQVVVNACEQCGRITVPIVETPIALPEYLTENTLAENTISPKLLLHTGEAPSIKEIAIQSNAMLLSGPEGGFADAEISAATQAGYQAVSLGPRILRTETAPLAALAILQALYGDI
jgi:16S rRNA (uracil1498-N3)-methyltransferase